MANHRLLESLGKILFNFYLDFNDNFLFQTAKTLLHSNYLSSFKRVKYKGQTDQPTI